MRERDQSLFIAYGWKVFFFFGGGGGAGVGNHMVLRRIGAGSVANRVLRAGGL